MAHKSIQKYSCSVNVAFRSLSPEIEILVHNVFKSCVIILFIIKIFARLNIFKFLNVNIPSGQQDQAMCDEKFQENVISLIIKVNRVEDLD